MYLAYIDESGDRGAAGSHTYTLGCVFVKSARWRKAFDGLVEFRRFLRGTLNVRMRTEIKANHLIRNSGDFRPLQLSEHARHFIYKGLLGVQPKLGLSAFAIVINKSKLFPGTDPLVQAWTFLLQRLETLTRKQEDQVLIIHDEGEPDTIRKCVRKARRFAAAGSLFGGSRALPFAGVIDDPVSRNSRHSYFLQLADLNAYAAFRRVYSPPPQKVKIVPHSMWDELGTARFKPVSMRAGGPSVGIVLWPK